MKIFIASDHRGIEVQQIIKEYLLQKKYDISGIDLVNNELDDYPDFAFKVCNKVITNKDSIGILICGNGIGMSIAANKVKGIRAARAINELDAYNGRYHNGANVLCLGSDLEIEKILSIVDKFITTELACEEKHLNRINKIIKYENGEYNEL